jgi:hypothetical protein
MFLFFIAKCFAMMINDPGLWCWKQQQGFSGVKGESKMILEAKGTRGRSERTFHLLKLCFTFTQEMPNLFHKTHNKQLV